MSDSAAFPEPTIPAKKAPWDWWMLNFLIRELRDPSREELHQYLRQASGTGVSPLYVLRLTLGAGALEGLLLGFIQGGILCVIFSVFWGLLVGLLCGMIICKARQSVSIVVLSVLAGVLIEAMGSWLIALYIPFFAGIRFWVLVKCFLFLLSGFPWALLLIILHYREIRAVLAGLKLGAFVGTIGFSICGVYLATEFGVWWALPLGGLMGALFGPLLGAIIGGLFLGPLVGALLNVNRRTILPTYFGFAGGFALGVAGRIIGVSIAGDVGDVLGVLVGFPLGAAVGIAFGVLLTPRPWRKLSFKDDTDPRNPAVFNMSNGRRLADLADTPDREALVTLLLGQLAFRIRKLHLEPVGELFGELYRVTLESSDSTLDPPPPIPFITGRELITELKELAGLGATDGGDSFRRREGYLQIMVSSHRVDLYMIFEPTDAGDRVTLISQEDAGAADAAARVADRFLFLLKARQWLSAIGWPLSRGLRGIV